MYKVISIMFGLELLLLLILVRLKYISRIRVVIWKISSGVFRVILEWFLRFLFRFGGFWGLSWD